MQAKTKLKYSVISVEILSPIAGQALRQMFIVGCQFDQRFSYGRIGRLARQSSPFLRLSMKLFGLRSARFHGRLLSTFRRAYALVPIGAQLVHWVGARGRAF